MCFQSIGCRAGLSARPCQSRFGSGPGSGVRFQWDDSSVILSLPSRAAATCSASLATVNHVTVSSPRNPNPLARDPLGPGCLGTETRLKPDAAALRIKNGRKWSPRAPCFVITVPLVSLYSAPPSFSSRRLRVNIGKRPARFCPNGYNIPSSRLRSWQRLFGLSGGRGRADKSDLVSDMECRGLGNFFLSVRWRVRRWNLVNQRLNRWSHSNHVFFLPQL